MTHKIWSVSVCKCKMTHKTGEFEQFQFGNVKRHTNFTIWTVSVWKCKTTAKWLSQQNQFGGIHFHFCLLACLFYAKKVLETFWKHVWLARLKVFFQSEFWDRGDNVSCYLFYFNLQISHILFMDWIYSYISKSTKATRFIAQFHAIFESFEWETRVLSHWFVWVWKY